MIKKLFYNLIFVSVVTLALTAGKVYAGCESNYGGGETCTNETGFDVDKDVRLKGDAEWKDKITNVKKGDKIEFRIKVKNTGDVEADGMKYSDSLPDEMKKIGGDGLTEEWEAFGSGDTKSFVIEAQVKDSEFDRVDIFEKCVVNEVRLKKDSDNVGSATATVCYGKGTPTELPETGSTSAIVAVTGFGLIVFGLFLKRFRTNN